jgi:hypothetical protein
MAKCVGRTRKNRPCKYEAEKGSLVCRYHRHQNPQPDPVKSRSGYEYEGPTPDLSDEVKAAIREAVEVGATNKTAAQAAGVDYATLERWLDENTDDLGTEVDQLRGNFEVDMLRAISRAAKNGDWRAGVWALETSGAVVRGPSPKPRRGDDAAIATGGQDEPESEEGVDTQLPEGMVDDQVGPDGNPL